MEHQLVLERREQWSTGARIREVGSFETIYGCFVNRIFSSAKKVHSEKCLIAANNT